MPVPEAIAITNTTLSIAVNAFKACQNAYNLVQGIKDAPKHILRLTTDIQGLFQVLGLLQTALTAGNVSSVQLPSQMIAHLTVLLGTCTKICNDVILVVSKFVNPDGTVKRGIWRSLNWEVFKKNDVDVLQQTLASCKLAISLAVSSLNFVTGTQTQNSIDQLQKDVALLTRHAEWKEQRDQIEDSPDRWSTQACPSEQRLSTASYDLPLRRYLEETESLIDSDSSSSRVASAVIPETGRAESIPFDHNDASRIAGESENIENPIEDNIHDQISVDDSGNQLLRFSPESMAVVRELMDSSPPSTPEPSDSVDADIKNDNFPKRIPKAVEEKAISDWPLKADPACRIAAQQATRSSSEVINTPTQKIPTALYMRALYDYEDDDRECLSFHEGDFVLIITQLESGWWDGVIHGVRGWVPSNYLEFCSESDAIRGESNESRVNVKDSADDEYTDSEFESEDEDHYLVGEPTTITSTSWIPQATLNGRLFYFNVRTHEISVELPLGKAPTEPVAGGLKDAKEASVEEESCAEVTKQWMPVVFPDGERFSYNITNCTVRREEPLRLETENVEVRVDMAGNYVTVVVPLDTTFQDLVDRLEPRIGQLSHGSIDQETLRLRYLDQDGDAITIESDDDLQNAFLEWRESRKYQQRNERAGIIELFCLSDDYRRV